MYCVRIFIAHLASFSSEQNSSVLLCMGNRMGPSKLRKLQKMPESRSDEGNFCNF